MSRGLARTVAGATIGLAVASAAHGQLRETRMDANGEWLNTREPAEGTDEWVVARARTDMADDRPSAAYSTINRWIEEQEARLGDPSPMMPEAVLVRGDALTAMGDEYNALYDYERVIREYPGDPAYVLAVERELDIGVRYLEGYKRKILGVRILNADDIGEELLIRCQERLPGSRIAERAGIELADYYYREHNLPLAAEAYEIFNELYRNSQYTMKAMQRRVYATIAQFKGPRYDGSKLVDARILVKRFSSLYPGEAQKAGLDESLLARLDESAANARLEKARYYLKQGDGPSGRYVMKRLIADHPHTAAAREAYATMEQRGWKPDEAKAPPAPQATQSPRSSRAEQSKEKQAEDGGEHGR